MRKQLGRSRVKFETMTGGNGDTLFITEQFRTMWESKASSSQRSGAQLIDLSPDVKAEPAAAAVVLRSNFAPPPLTAAARFQHDRHVAASSHSALGHVGFAAAAPAASVQPLYQPAFVRLPPSAGVPDIFGARAAHLLPEFVRRNERVWQSSGQPLSAVTLHSATAALPHSSSAHAHSGSPSAMQPYPTYIGFQAGLAHFGAGTGPNSGSLSLRDQRSGGPFHSSPDDAGGSSWNSSAQGHVAAPAVASGHRMMVAYASASLSDPPLSAIPIAAAALSSSSSLPDEEMPQAFEAEPRRPRKKQAAAISRAHHAFTVGTDPVDGASAAAAAAAAPVAAEDEREDKWLLANLHRIPTLTSGQEQVLEKLLDRYPALRKHQLPPYYMRSLLRFQRRPAVLESDELVHWLCASTVRVIQGVQVTMWDYRVFFRPLVVQVGVWALRTSGRVRVRVCLWNKEAHGLSICCCSV